MIDPQTFWNLRLLLGVLSVSSALLAGSFWMAGKRLRDIEKRSKSTIEDLPVSKHVWMNGIDREAELRGRE